MENDRVKWKWLKKITSFPNQSHETGGVKSRRKTSIYHTELKQGRRVKKTRRVGKSFVRNKSEISIT